MRNCRTADLGRLGRFQRPYQAVQWTSDFSHALILSAVAEKEEKTDLALLALKEMGVMEPAEVDEAIETIVEEEGTEK